jgi:hypothetical protein
MSLFTEHPLDRERIKLPSGRVEKVQKFCLHFRKCVGGQPPRTHGSKPAVDCDGNPVFAEIAIIPLLKQDGFDGAVWVDNWHGYHFRDAMPSAPSCELPADVRGIYDRIVKENGRRGGCWDVLAWNGDRIKFVECKRRKKDSMRPSQKKWLESARNVGLHKEQFAICEWVLD